jgi:hypothetical protein
LLDRRAKEAIMASNRSSKAKRPEPRNQKATVVDLRERLAKRKSDSPSSPTAPRAPDVAPRPPQRAANPLAAPHQPPRLSRSRSAVPPRGAIPLLFVLLALAGLLGAWLMLVV